ncbi:disease resistance protein RUN1-like [Solanum stenotomum]|uniref:disease resistance protein RUN1-like n=1 Tax=Solanum stenotomum TaxID=172797 RepID=UPI0020D12A5A|nr:disease resistance protein RUN1-like [Solanum stenotomum]
MANLYSPCNEVFLNFRGKDVRRTFLDHLYKALCDAGIIVFRDDDELPRGEDISRSLLEAIEESKISLVVFSKNYASSKWCLNELVKILECKEKLGQHIFPIFYDVHPSEVRHQTGKIGDSLAKHESNSSPEQLRKWRAALTAVANLKGLHLQNHFNGSEVKFIEMIIQEVEGKLNKKYMDIARHPVGINSRVNELINKLSWTVSSDVMNVGIWGMGGVGKTTLAKAIFNQISPNFDGSSFLHVGSEVSRGDSYLVALQEKLLKDTLRKRIDVSSVDHGIELIKQRLQSKRVLIILDEVVDDGQIYSLVGGKNWLGPGSRIIITTRDERLLKCSTGDVKYEVKCMTESESLQLFCWHAFENPFPPEDFVEVSESVVTYAQGLPLALEVWGSDLYKRGMVEWKSFIEKLKQIPHNSIIEKLRISFDGLPDHTTKETLLDIACFLEGWDKEDASKVLSSCGFFPEIGINVLIEKSLVTINESNQLSLHNLIRDMGREIVRTESKDPGERSRLWDPDDILDLITRRKGGEKVEALKLVEPVFKDMCVSTKVFSEMKNLRLLQIDHLTLQGSFKDIFKELRVLSWNDCHLEHLPSDLHLDKLVILDVKHSSFKESPSTKHLRCLKILDLSYCESLVRTSDFTGSPMLEKLVFRGCSSLTEVHSSIGYLEVLGYLDFTGCKKLQGLPDSICKLKSLEKLYLNDCTNLQQLPADMGNLRHLTALYAMGTSIKQLPVSCGLLKNLQLLEVGNGCKILQPKSRLSIISSFLASKDHDILPSSIINLPSLEVLKVPFFNLCQRDIPNRLGQLFSLEVLDLSGNNFHSLPLTLSHLSKLKTLSLYGCPNLLMLPNLPCNLEALSTRNCRSLEMLPDLSSADRLQLLDFCDCSKLVEIRGLENLKYLKYMNAIGCMLTKNPLAEGFFKANSTPNGVNVFLQCNEIPSWFDYRVVGSSISLIVPRYMDQEFLGMIVWAICRPQGEHCVGTPIAIITDQTNRIEYPLFGADIPVRYESYAWVSYMPRRYFKRPIKGGEKMMVSIKEHHSSKEGLGKKFGVHLLFATSPKGKSLPLSRL